PAIEPDEAEMRDQMFGAYHNGTAYLGAADALLRAGEPRTAARAVLGGVQAHPDNIALWTALGRALAAADGGTASPAA
ncbi:tetratricopeptide repeat protein, partial [Enterococcus faecium]